MSEAKRDPNPFICPVCHKPVEPADYRVGPGDLLFHSGCKTKQELRAPKNTPPKSKP